MNKSEITKMKREETNRGTNTKMEKSKQRIAKIKIKHNDKNEKEMKTKFKK